MFVFAGRTRTCTICTTKQMLVAQPDRQYECADSCAGFRRQIFKRISDNSERPFYECVDACAAPLVVRLDAAGGAPYCEESCGNQFVNASYYGNTVKNTIVCVSKCASGFADGKTCVSGCARFWDPPDGLGHSQCRDSCSGNHTSDGMCVSACPDNYYYLGSTKTCYKACPNGYADNEKTRTCEFIVCPASRPFRELDGTC